MVAYLDYNATTPIDPRVRELMEKFSGEAFGNASSKDHRWGWDAAEAVERSRIEVACIAESRAHEVLFTSSATEALNTVVRGYLDAAQPAPTRIITCATEHDAVLAPSRRWCERAGTPLDVLAVDHAGRVDLGHLRELLDGGAGALVALMAANNEIGTIHPIHHIADMVHAAGGRLLCDTTQGFGRIPISLEQEGIDYATMAAHKMYGPKGVGALVYRRDARQGRIEPLILGGGEEGGWRGGTLNVAGIAGFGEACRLARQCLTEEMKCIGVLRDRLEDGILSQVPETWVNGDRTNRLCNTSNVGIRNVEGRALIRQMHDVAASTRAACSTGDPGPSHVLKAIGLSDEDAYSCVRFSLGRFTTEAVIDFAIERVAATVHKLRRSKSI
jgi:cysteine desulfurase